MHFIILKKITICGTFEKAMVGKIKRKTTIKNCLKNLSGEFKVNKKVIKIV